MTPSGGDWNRRDRVQNATKNQVDDHVHHSHDKYLTYCRLSKQTGVMCHVRKLIIFHCYTIEITWGGKFEIWVDYCQSVAIYSRKKWHFTQCSSCLIANVIRGILLWAAGIKHHSTPNHRFDLHSVIRFGRPSWYCKKGQFTPWACLAFSHTQESVRGFAPNILR